MAYPDFYEEKSSRQMTFTRRGAHGKTIWIATWETRFLAAPLLDTSYPGYPGIRCYECTFEPYGNTGDGSAIYIPDGTGGYWWDTYDYTHCRITALYEYDVLTGDEPQLTGDCSVDIINVGEGRKWTDAKTPGTETPCPVEEPVPRMIPTLSYSARYIANPAQFSGMLAAAYALTGTVNNAPWRGAEAEHMLYEGMSWDSDYNVQTGQFRYTVEHRFRWRSFSWNEIWRPAHHKLNADGMPEYDNYGFPIYDIEADWDRPDPPIYDAADFTPLETSF